MVVIPPRLWYHFMSKLKITKKQHLPLAIQGREKDKEKMINVLLETISCCSSSSSDSRVSVVPIVGMGGLGKTTLARLIYNDKGVSDTFELRIWVHVSIDFDVKKILRHIIESATHKTFDKDANMDMLEQIMKDILSDKRYFLVLDDLWNLTTEVWNKLDSTECWETWK